MDSIIDGLGVQFLLFGAALVLYLVELALSAVWNQAYFSVGLPIFVRRLPVNGYRLAPLDTTRLESKFDATFTGKSLEFKEFNPNLYAFREKLFEFRMLKMKSTQVMHGVVILDQNEHQVIVKGYVNWGYAVLMLALLAVLLTTGSQAWSITILVLFILVISFGFSYAVQANRYNQVAQTAAEWAAR
jgi:hypothetical protein